MTIEMSNQGEAPRSPRITLLPTPRALPALLANRILRGCNLHHTDTVIRQEVDLGGLAGMRSNQAGAAFAERFLERFFELRRLVPEGAMPGGFVERLRSPTGVPLCEALLEAILAVDSAMAFHRHDFSPIGFSAVVPTDSPRRVLLVWECSDTWMSRKAAEVGFNGFAELLPDELQPFQCGGSEVFPTAFAELADRARRRERSTTTAVVALAARGRDLPCTTLAGPFLRLGQGALQRVIYASTSETTSLPASQLARNKYRTNRRLAAQRLPVGRQIKAASVEEALAAAARIGYPVVIKPLKQKQATGVSVGIAGPDEIPAAFARAELARQRASQRIIVEEHLRGRAHRLLVVGGRFIAALMTVPSTVQGDGKRTIAELVEEINGDPSRDGVRLFKIPFDENLIIELERRGFKLSDVLPKNQTLAVHLAANAAIGGVHHDVTDNVHPDNQELAIRATQAIGLSVAGIDFVTEDISRSYKEVGGGIIEVNSRPGLCMHTYPRHGKSRPVAAAVLEQLFPAGSNGRIPAAVVAGRRRTARVARDLEAMLVASGKTIALATRRGCTINGQSAGLEKVEPHGALTRALGDQRVQALISCVSIRRAVNHGLGLDSCDVTAIMDRRIDSSYEHAFRQGLGLLARATRSTVVVNAANKHALETLSSLETKRLILVASNAKNPVVAAHASAGGAFVTHKPGKRKAPDRIELRRQREVLVSVPVARSTGDSRARHVAKQRTQARMFAIALAFGMGLGRADIEAGLRSQR